ncbi:MAG: hypothetical protein ACK4ZR_03865 [Aquificaceae bacterium]
MMRPTTLLESTALYIFLCFLLILFSLIQKLFGGNYIDNLVFLAFPGLIFGVLFQMLPTFQGYPFKGRPLIYMHLLLWFINIAYFFFRGGLQPYLYLSFSFLSLLLILINLRRLYDPIVLFFLLGTLFFALASLLNLLGKTPLLVKHVITVGFFMSVIIGSYYIFVPMLQIENIKEKTLIWINLILQGLSGAFSFLSWHLFDFRLVAYSGLFLLLSLGVLSYSLYQALSQRQSPLKGLDISVQFLILGLFLCWFSLLLGVFMAGGKNFLLLKAHADGMLYGFLSLITVGASYHIAPFLLWWKLYAQKMGRERVPTLKEILEEKIVRMFLIAFPFLLTGLLVGDLMEPLLERAFSLLFLLLFGYYTFKLSGLTFKILAWR